MLYQYDDLDGLLSYISNQLYFYSEEGYVNGHRKLIDEYRICVLVNAGTLQELKASWGIDENAFRYYNETIRILISGDIPDGKFKIVTYATALDSLLFSINDSV